MSGYLAAVILGATLTLAAIDDMVKRARECVIEQERFYAEAVSAQVAEMRSSFDVLARRRQIAADDLQQRIEMAVLFGCPDCGGKPREVGDVVVCCGDRSLSVDHPDRFVIACVRCVPAATRVRA